MRGFQPRERSLEMEDAKAAGTQLMGVVEQEDSCWAGPRGAASPLPPHPCGGDLKVSASVRGVQTRRYVQSPNWLVWFSLKFPGELSGLGMKQAS